MGGGGRKVLNVLSLLSTTCLLFLVNMSWENLSEYQGLLFFGDNYIYSHYLLVAFDNDSVRIN